MSKKLCAKEKPVTVSRMDSDSYHCCCWCKWCEHDNDSWKCTNPCYSGVDTTADFTVRVAEDGHLSDTLNEALHNVPRGVQNFLTGLKEQLYKWNVSPKRVREFEKVFSECLDQFLDMELKEVIDSQVSRLYNHAASESYTTNGVFIKDPFTHYCREFE